jgi:HlyD family secretion protein
MKVNKFKTKEKAMRSYYKKTIKFFSIFISLLILGSLILSLAACRPEIPDMETVKATRGDIIEKISSTGTVDSTEMMNYSVLQAAEILEILKKGDTFKRGQTLIKIDNSRTELLIKQAEQNLVLAEQAIDVAKINYQSALDANHVAIQLAETNTKAAEESSASAFKALENANISAASAYVSASKALESSSNISELTVKNAEDALDEAKRIYNTALSTPGITPEELAQFKHNVELAENAYELAKKQEQANLDSSGGNLESVDAQNRISVSTAESGYQQALSNQSSIYWNNLSSLQLAEAQIELTRKNIEQAEIQLELSIISSELAELDRDTFLMAATFDGIVLAANFSKGEYASPGIAALTVINDDFIVRSDINETDIARVETGQQVEITFDAYPDMKFNGTVSEISPISKNIAGIVSFEITIELDPDAKEYLKYGLSANVDIIISDTRDILYVPVEAVYKENGKEYVDVLTEENEIKKVEVTTGNYDYNNIEIKSGLSEGDTIILSAIDEVVQEDSGPGFFNFGN